MSNQTIILCPGQGAQAVGMGKAWAESSPAAKAIFDEADAILGGSLGSPLSTLCFEGPAETLNKTNVSQPAIYAASVACWAGLVEAEGVLAIHATAGLSLGEYTALHLAGVFDFETGLRLVARRGQLMQDAAEASDGGMVALIGADEDEAQAVCDAARGDDVLVCANFNAPGQIVISGSRKACERALPAAEAAGLRVTALAVAGAFHSPLMQPAADAMGEALTAVEIGDPAAPVWANVTATPHKVGNPELLRNRLVEQIVSPVRWSASCRGLIEATKPEVSYHELAPGNVLRGLMRRIDRKTKVTSHDAPSHDTDSS